MDLIFTKNDLITIKVAMQFIREGYYHKEEDKSTDTYKNLKSIEKKCKDAIEK